MQPTKPSIGDDEKNKGGDKVTDNQGVNPAGGTSNKNTENDGTNTGPIIKINLSDDDDKDDHIHGGIQGKVVVVQYLVVMSMCYYFIAC